MCFWWKEVGPFTIRFENNKLYYGENTEAFTPEKNWPSVLGDLNISSGTDWHRTDWKPNGHSATSTKSYADDYGFNIYNMVMIVAILEILVSLADTDLQIISVLQCHMKQKIHDLVYITVLIRRLQRKMLLIFLKLVYIPILWWYTV
jgi:hypothetical protein